VKGLETQLSSAIGGGGGGGGGDGDLWQSHLRY